MGAISPAAQTVVSQAMLSLGEVDIPQVLQDSIDQHQRNLTRLAAALLAGGHDVDHVRRTVETALESFKGELSRTIEALMETGHAV